MAKVSVILPTYNHEKYVSEAIRSVLDQTYEDFELLIADDGSSDDTVARVKEFDDPRITFSVFEENQGACTIGNWLLARATGEYVAVFHSDDVFMPDKLEKQVRFLDDNPQYGAVFSNVKLIDDDSEPFTDTTHPWFNLCRQPNRNRFEWLNFFFFNGNCLCHPSILIRKACYDEVGLFDERMAQLADLDLWFRLCMQYDIHILPDELIKFRVRSGGQNASGMRPEVLTRDKFEFSNILKRYLQIKDLELFEKVFPEITEHGWSRNVDDIPVVLAKLALSEKCIHPGSRLFAVLTLFEHMHPNDAQKELTAGSWTSYRDFIRETGRDDLFGFFNEFSLREQLEERDRLIDEIKSGLTEKEQQLQANGDKLFEVERLLNAKSQELLEAKRLFAQREHLIAEKNRQLSHLTEQNSLMMTSRSWRFTGPMRALGRLLREIRASLKPILRALRDKVRPQGTSSLLRYNIESTKLRQTFNGNIMFVSGWYFAKGKEGPFELEIVGGEEILARFTCDERRPDVCRAYSKEIPDDTSRFLCGFRYWADIPHGLKKVEIRAVPGGEVLRKIDINRLSDSDGSVWLVSHPAATGRKDGSIGGNQTAHYLSLRPDASVSREDKFVERNQVRQQVRKLMEKGAAKFLTRPMISIIMPVYNADPDILEEAIESVRNQIYPEWELCLADDASTRAETRDILKRIENGPRIKITYREENGHISAASNDAAALATGEFVALMDQDDLLAPDALFEIVRLLQNEPDADVIYSDEDKVDQQGKHYGLHFKPDWSPTLLLGYNYFNHLTCIRRSLFEKAGGFRSGFEGAQDYDLVLRAAELTDRIFHIPRVLYHWRAIPGSTAYSAEEKPIVADAANRALAEALHRQGINARIYLPEVTSKLKVPVHQLDWPDDGPGVEIIIPTLNNHKILNTCIDSILEKTTYRNFRIMVVDNDSDEPESLKYLESISGERVRVERIGNDEVGFSFARINNLAVAQTEAEYVLFLNDDTEVMEPRWLSRLVGYGQLPGVGAVGARLLYPDDTIQHGGVVLGMGGGFIPDHAFSRLPKDAPGYFFLPHTAREVSAVTGACLLTGKATFLAAGGFDEARYRVSLNDVDYCLRLQEQGQRVLYVPGAELCHHESLTRDREDDPRELADFRGQHGNTDDPYYSPNLSDEDSYAIRPGCTLDFTEYLEQPLKVVYFTHNLNFEGAPKILFDVAQGLKERGNIEPAIVAPCDGEARGYLEDLGIKVDVLKVRHDDNILLPWDSEEELRSAVRTMEDHFLLEKPDVVVANVLLSYFVVEAAHNTGIPSLWWIHESYDPPLLTQNVQPIGMRLFEEAFDKASSVLFVSRDTANLYSRYNLRNNFSVIKNSLHEDSYPGAVSSETKAAARQELGIGEDEKVVLSVGTICERKDQGTIVAAVEKLSRNRDDLKCFLVGYREYLTYGKCLKERVDERGLERLVKLVPETRNVDKYYLAADIFAFASLNESYSLTILEAMAFGLPIVTTGCFGTGEQVRFGVNALPVEFQNVDQMALQLETLLDDKAKRELFARNSRELNRYMQSFDEMVKKHEDITLMAWQAKSEMGSISALSPLPDVYDDVVKFSAEEVRLIQQLIQILGMDRSTFHTNISSEDEMLLFDLDHVQKRQDAILSYFYTGSQMLDIVRQIIVWRFGSLENINSFMDFACGYGRFTRHLVQVMDPEKIRVSDIYADAVAFQEREFGVTGYVSAEDPEEYQDENRCDFIFVASLFSHLSANAFHAWLEKLQTLLTPGGVLVFSVHDISLKPESIEMDHDGMAFYPKSESRSLDPQIYGSTYVTEKFVRAAIEKTSAGGCVVHRLPRGLCGFQDIYVVAMGQEPDHSALKVNYPPQGFLDSCEWHDNGEVFLSGWAAEPVHGSEHLEVEVYVNGKVVQRCKPGIMRQDVADLFGDDMFLYSGWSCSLSGRNLKAKDVINVMAINRNGQKLILMVKEVEQINSPISRSIQECKEVHQETTYYEDAEPHMEEQWNKIIWPKIKDFDFSSVLELAPGFGRNTELLIKHAGEITLVDVNQHCIDACRERFAVEKRCTVHYMVNDGKSLSGIPDSSVTMIYSWDSVVHFDKEVVKLYAKEFTRVMAPGGKGFVHHSNYGHTSQSSDWLSHPHNRSNMTDELFARYIRDNGMEIISQELLDWDLKDLDCVSVFRKPM